LVAGHYLPLADNPGIAPESDQTCSLQSDQKTLEKAPRLRGRLRRLLATPRGGSADGPAKPVPWRALGPFSVLSSPQLALR
jgi:hypothetical protein